MYTFHPFPLAGQCAERSFADNVGLDVERARAELARLAPLAAGLQLAAQRAAALDLRPAGAAERIVAALEHPPAG